MAKKKDFKNPALNFISQESIDRVEAPAPTGKAPEGYKPNPAFIETKSKRLQLLIQPSLHRDAKAIADKELHISLNDFINRALYEATYNEEVKEKIRKDLER